MFASSLALSLFYMSVILSSEFSVSHFGILDLEVTAGGKDTDRSEILHTDNESPMTSPLARAKAFSSASRDGQAPSSYVIDGEVPNNVLLRKCGTLGLVSSTALIGDLPEGSEHSIDFASLIHS